MAGFQNSFDSQSVTNVVLFEIYEDNMVSRRPDEQGAVKAVLDDCRFFFCLNAKMSFNKWRILKVGCNVGWEPYREFLSSSVS